MNPYQCLRGAITFVFLLTSPFLCAKTTEYSLVVERKQVTILENPLEKITINDTIPGPTLRFTEGDEALIHVTNKLEEHTSIHWHGFLLPSEMDGVPGFNGFSGINPGETFTYRFPIRQSGTYWYHAHSGTQEQDGHYGSIIIDPKESEPIRFDREYVILLSDFTEEESASIMANLKKESHYYNYAQRTIGDFFDDVAKQGFSKAWKNMSDWAWMRMSPSDLTDVSGYTFLVNGKSPEQNWTGLFKAGERIRLRFINASAMSTYDVRIPGLKMTVVQADGQNVEPVEVDEFRFFIAETYDAIVTPAEEKPYTIIAESIDRTGFALGTLAPREGMRGELPEHRPRALLTMADMGHGMDHGSHEMKMSEDAQVDHHSDHMTHDDMKSGWAQASTPPGHRALKYSDLKFAEDQKDTRPPEREILITLGGNMERFIWTINGKKFEESGFEPIRVTYGERVRLKFVNETMMAHPMHLHGMFVQPENGQSQEKLPNKHTMNIPPGQSYSVLLTADEPGEWAFHCHMLFHMDAGMMTKLIVSPFDPSKKGSPATKAESVRAVTKYQEHGEHHHVY